MKTDTDKHREQVDLTAATFAVRGDVDKVPGWCKRYGYKGHTIYATSRNAALDYAVYALGFCCILPRLTNCLVYVVRGRKILAESLEIAELVFKRCYRLRVSDLKNCEVGACELTRRLRKQNGVF